MLEKLWHDLEDLGFKPALPQQVPQAQILGSWREKDGRVTVCDFIGELWMAASPIAMAEFRKTMNDYGIVQLSH